MPDLELEGEKVGVQPKKKTRQRKSSPKNHSGLNCPDCFVDKKSSPMHYHSSAPLSYGEYSEMIVRYECPECKSIWSHRLAQMKKVRELRIPKEEFYE